MSALLRGDIERAREKRDAMVVAEPVPPVAEPASPPVEALPPAEPERPPGLRARFLRRR